MEPSEHMITINHYFCRGGRRGPLVWVEIDQAADTVRIHLQLHELGGLMELTRDQFDAVATVFEGLGETLWDDKPAPDPLPALAVLMRDVRVFLHNLGIKWGNLSE